MLTLVEYDQKDMDIEPSIAKKRHWAFAETL